MAQNSDGMRHLQTLFDFQDGNEKLRRSERLATLRVTEEVDSK